MSSELQLLLVITLKMCVAARNSEKFTKTLILEVQGRSSSSILIRLKTL